MTATTALIILFVYVGALLLVARWKGKDSDNASFFIGKKDSPWYVVAFGMIGASLSGVTFLSVPGAVRADDFSYFQMVLGYVPGYMFIAFVLIPVYYKLNLTTIYGYLDQRFGTASYKTGSAFFLLSRIVGASFRIYLVVIVLQLFVFDRYDIPFAATVAFTLGVIWIYTNNSGIRSIVWTDSLQTFAMLAAVLLTIFIIKNAIGLNMGQLVEVVRESSMSKTFFFENGWSDPRNFWKQFLAGASIAIVMTGLDQDMMQKNLSCRSKKEAQKNVVSFTIVLVAVNFLFLVLGALLYIFAGYKQMNVPEPDAVYPMLASLHLGIVGSVIFFIGVIAAAFSSADSALTALTTVVCVDFLGFEKSEEPQKVLQRRRKYIHFGITFLLFWVIVVFNMLPDDSVINKIFRFAGYTYGPLLGLYMMGLFTKINPRDALVPVICIIAPVASHGIKWLIESNTAYNMGFEFLILNGLVTFIGLALIGINRPKRTLEQLG